MGGDNVWVVHRHGGWGTGAGARLHSIYGDRDYYGLLRNGAKLSAAKIKSQSLISPALAFLCPTHIH